MIGANIDGGGGARACTRAFGGIYGYLFSSVEMSYAWHLCSLAGISGPSPG